MHLHGGVYFIFAVKMGNNSVIEGSGRMRIQQLFYFEKIVEKGSANEMQRLICQPTKFIKGHSQLELEMDITSSTGGNTGMALTGEGGVFSLCSPSPRPSQFDGRKI